MHAILLGFVKAQGPRTIGVYESGLHMFVGSSQQICR